MSTQVSTDITQDGSHILLVVQALHCPVMSSDVQCAGLATATVSQRGWAGAVAVERKPASFPPVQPGWSILSNPIFFLQ